MPLYPLKDVVVCGTKKEKKTTFRIPTHLDLVKQMGAGAYGCVAAFKDTRNGEMLAVKKVSNAFVDVVDGKRILREVKLMRQFDHDNIVRILDMYPPPGPDFEDIYIAMDLMETDLHRVIYSKQPLTEEHHQYFTHQILRGLVYLHNGNVVHRDLKPSNLLVNKNCDLKICDFGLARVLEVQDGSMGGLQSTDYVVTRWYRAPEVVLLASEYNNSIDVWAVGCILCELIGRRTIFDGKNHLDQIKTIIDILGTPSEDELVWLPQSCSARGFLAKCKWAEKVKWKEVYPKASNEALEVIEAMLRFNPMARISVQDALRMKYFEQLFEEEDLIYDMRLQPLDWSFDNFTPTKELLQKYIYRECAAFHPEIYARDQSVLKERGLDKFMEEDLKSKTRSGPVISEFV